MVVSCSVSIFIVRLKGELRAAVILFAVPLMAQTSFAQRPLPAKDTINADRPDQTESPHIVPRGKFQVESGIFISPFDSSGGKTPVVGMCVIRYGLSERLELRLMAEDGRDRDRYLEETTQGVFPLAAGGKLLLLERKSGLVPQIALLGWLKIPVTNRSSEQAIYWSPQLMLAFENRIGKVVEIEYNAGAKQEVYGPRWQGMASLSVHIIASNQFKIFTEYFGQYQPQEDPVQNVDGGLIWTINPSLQLDIAAGRSVSAPLEQSSSFATLGCSFLLQ